MSKRFLTVLALLLLLMTLVVSPILGTVGVARAEELPVTPQSDTSDPNQVAGPVVWLRPLDSLVRPGGQTSFELVVKNVTDLYGLSLDLKYDPSLLTLVHVPDEQAIATSGLYDGVINDYDSGTGEVTLADLLTGSVPGLDFDDGEWHRLALLKFEVSDAVFNGTLGFSLVPASNNALINGTAMVKLSNSAGQPISFAGFGGDVNISVDAAIVSGRVTAAGSDPIVGLPDVRVELMPMAPDTEPIAAITDQDGNYECPVPPGEYKLAARTDPWVAAPYAGKYFSQDANQYNWPEATAFTLATRDEKVVDLSLELGQVISGKVTDTAAGTPLEQIWVHAVNASNMFNYDTCSGSTNPLGEYRLVVPAGSFYIIARGGQMFGDAWYRVGSDEQTAIQSEAGGAIIGDIDIALEQRVTVNISGTVVDADAPNQPPLSGVRVEIRSYDDPVDIALTTQTDALGHYKFTVPDGCGYRVFTEDYLSGSIPYAQMFYNDAGGSFSWDGATPVNVNGESVAGVNFALKQSGWIEGDVTDAAGNALPYTVVAAITPGQPGLRFASVKIDSSGHYQLVVPPGEYGVVAEYHEQLYYPEVWYPNVISRDLAKQVTVAVGTTTENIDFWVAPTVNHISGQVLDENGNPVEWLPVCAYVVDEDQSVKPYAMERTNDQGVYGIELPVGTYLIGTMARAWHQPFVDEWYNNQVDQASATPLTMSDASHENIDFTLDRLPHANVAPSCFFTDKLPSSTKIELNAAKLGLTEDQLVYYEIRAWNDGAVKQSGQINFDFDSETSVYNLLLPNSPVLPQDGVAGYDVMLYSDSEGTPLAFGDPIVIFDSSFSRTLHGTVLQEGSNAPIEGARVVAEGFDKGHIRFEAITEATGDYSLRLPGVVVEEYRISVDKKAVFPTMWYSNNGLTNQWGEATPVTVKSEDGTTLHIAVPTQMPSLDIGIWPRCIFDDETAPEMHVWIKPGQSGLTEAVTISYEVLEKTDQQTPTGVFGTFNYVPTNANYDIQLSQLDAGEYVIEFSVGDKLLTDPTLMVYAADEAGSISGHVTSGGEDLIGVQVLAEGYDNKEIVFDTHTGETGGYHLRLPAGDYRIAVQPVVEGPLVWYDNATWENAQKLTVASGASQDIDITVGTSASAAELSIGHFSARQNDIIEVPVMLSNFPGINNYEIVIEYDPSVLTPIAAGGCVNGNILESAPVYNPAYNNTSQVKITSAQATATSDGTTLFTVKLTVNASATVGAVSQLQLLSPFISDGGDDSIALNITHGLVTVIDVTYGDVTGDGFVRSNDATAILQYVAGLRTFDARQLLAADATGDGNVRSNDATAVLQYVAGLISQLGPKN